MAPPQPPQQITIQPTSSFDVSLRPPGSKSLTNRALLLAALARGESSLQHVLLSDDTQRMIEALQMLGFQLEIDTEREHIRVVGRAGTIPASDAELNLGNAGTAMRSLTAACCLGHGTYSLDGIARMRQRPLGELVDPLRQLGAQIAYLEAVGYPPVQVFGGSSQLIGGELTMQPTLSSQFITALLIVGPYCRDGLTIRFQGSVTSRPYVRMTIALMRRFGAQVHADEQLREVRIAPGEYRAFDYTIEPDASSASYFLAAAAVVPGSRCRIEGLGTTSVQGDVRFANVLQQMGAAVHVSEHATEVSAPADGTRLRGVDVDLNDMPDMAQTLAAVAALGSGPTTIRNVGNLRVKETDRLAALQNELTKLGVRAMVHGDDLQIVPPQDGNLTPAAIDTYDDHRMAMSFAVIGLAHPGVTINDPSCVNKTFPGFFDELHRMTSQSGAAG